MVNRVERGDLKGKHRKVGSDEVKTLVITAVQIDHYTSTFPRKKFNVNMMYRNQLLVAFCEIIITSISYYFDPNI